MAFLGKGRKEDLRLLVQEMGLNGADGLKIFELKELITKSPDYEEDLVKNMLTNIIEERIEREKLAEEATKLEKERAFELERLKLQLETQKVTQTSATPSILENNQPNLDLRGLLPKYNPEECDMAMFLNLFERQLKFLKVSESTWVPYLIGLLPSDVGRLVAQEPEDEFRDYQKVKSMLLRRFKLTADKYRQLFAMHRKSGDHTWRDFYFEVSSYFEGWLTELEIKDFQKLKELIITDQIKKRVPPDVKDHFIDIWPNFNSPIELVEKLDTYDCLRTNQNMNVALSKQRKSPYNQHEDLKLVSSNKSFRPEKSYGSKPLENTGRSALTCYGCGRPGYTKATCPKCKPSATLSSNCFDNSEIQSLPTSVQSSIINLTINGVLGTACADSGATHSIAGERLYQILKEEGAKFEKSFLTMTLADGSQKVRKVHSTRVTVGLEGRHFPLTLLALPDAKRNRTLLGTDFLEKTGIVLNFRDRTWHFGDSPNERFQFAENSDVQSCDLKENATLANTHLLRPDEGEKQTEDQRKQINHHILKCETCFSPGGEATKFMENHINTRARPFVSVPTCRTNADMSSPNTVKQVQPFVRTCSWYRRYIPNFSQIAKPLTDLKKRKAIRKLEVKQENAFQDLKPYQEWNKFRTTARKTTVAPLKKTDRPKRVEISKPISPRNQVAIRRTPALPSSPPPAQTTEISVPDFVPRRRLRSLRGRM